ncbi:MAG: hypothetical protein ABID87_02815 [Chloroflexota bacterium]
MTDLALVEKLAEKLRQEPYRTLTNDCFVKSARLKRQLRRRGLNSRVIATIGLGQARLFGRWLTIPVLHGWLEVDGKRVETSRPLGSAGIWSIVPVNIRPVIKLRF